jgi:hypothetical protein
MPSSAPCRTNPKDREFWGELSLESQKEKGPHSWRPCILARSERFELPTPWFVAKYSIQMSYERVESETIHKAADEHKWASYNIRLTNQHQRSRTMEAEQLNSLANHLSDLADRAHGLRRYL